MSLGVDVVVLFVLLRQLDLSVAVLTRLWLRRVLAHLDAGAFTVVYVLQAVVHLGLQLKVAGILRQRLSIAMHVYLG